MPISDLPPELLAQIFEYLDQQQFFVARTTCGSFEQASLPVFGRRFFRKKGYLITTSSLDVLSNVANHVELCKYAQHIWINPDCWTFATPYCLPKNWEPCRPDSDEPYVIRTEEGTFQGTKQQYEQYTRYKAVARDHWTLLHTHALEERLADIFGKLPNLEVMGMRRSTDHSPWGWQRLNDMVDHDPRILGSIPDGPMRSLSGPTRLFMAMVKASARAGLRLKRLYTDAIELDNIRSTHLSAPELNAACGHLHWLEVNVTRAWLTNPDDAESDTAHHTDSHQHSTAAEEAYGARLAELLSATPNLRGLDLMLFPDRQQRHLVPPIHNQTESWRKSYPYIALERVSQTVRLTSLQRLKLDKITTSADTLMDLLRPCAAGLQSLKLRDVRLLSSCRRQGDARPWQRVFAFLMASCPALSYLLLYHLKHADGGVTFSGDTPVTVPMVFNMDVVPVWGSHGPAGGEMFTDFERISVVVQGSDDVRRKLADLVDNHWYGGRVFSYHLDDSVWFTDTSDEDGD